MGASGTSGLDRFFNAQADSYRTALDELRAGRKQTHWMWYIFPQIAGLGHSAMARHYAIADRVEARAYLGHDVLGRRLVECSETMLGWSGKRSAEAILGGIDAVKLRSSMTLFARSSSAPVFTQVIDAFYDGLPDARTLQLLDGG